MILVFVLLWWIGITLNAPNWYFVCLVFAAIAEC